MPDAATAHRPRRPRRQRATPPMILEAARRIADAEGWPAVTIRRVAEALGYTSPLIYEHFRDKDAALAEIVREGFLALVAALRAAAERPLAPADPDGYVLAVARAYLGFARARPAVYQLMHGMGGVVLDPGIVREGADLACAAGVAALERWSAAARIALPDTRQATEILWCALHGITCLALVGRLHRPATAPPTAGAVDATPAAPDASADALLDAAVHALLLGWRAPARATRAGPPPARPRAHP